MIIKNSERELREAIGAKLKKFRQVVMKDSNMTFDDYSLDVNIPVAELSAYERGESFPEYGHLVKIAEETGLNLNWLIYNNGSMFFCREQEMEEIIRRIEENEKGLYDHYKIMLKNMQNHTMEVFIFHIHDIIINFLSKLEQQIKKDKKGISVLTEMTKDVMYDPEKYL